MNILTILKEAEGLTPGESRLADYILKNTKDFIAMPPREIPDRLFISLPTVYRLIHKLGLKGLGEFKLELKAALLNQSELPVENINFPIDSYASISEILLRLKAVYAYTIADTLDLADSSTLYQVGALMEASEAIDVYAFAGNIFFADNFRFQMQEIGAVVNVPHEDYMQKLTASNSGPSHLSIVISFGGRGTASELLCRILKDCGSPIVLIASEQNKSLRRYAKYILNMSAYEDHYQKISSFSTRMTLLYILDTLYTVYFCRRYKANVTQKLNAYETIRSHMPRP